MKAEQDLPKDVLDNVLRVSLVIVVNDGRQITAHQLKKDPNSISIVVRSIDLQNSVLVLTLVHQSDLINN